MEIYYSLVIEHGHLVGDGTIGASHIDSDGATLGNALLADGSDGAMWGAVARPSVANTFTAAQTVDFNGTGLIVDARDYTGTAPAFEVIVGTSGDRKGFQIKQGDQNTAWASFEYSAGGSGKQGLGLGTGSGGRDVVLYRDAANVWRTPDNFHVGELRVDTAGRANSRNQLGLDLGTSAGNIVALNSDGRFDAERTTEPFEDVAYSGTMTWNLGSNPRGKVTLTGNTTLSTSGGLDGGIYVLKITQDSTGSRTMDFPNGWHWSGGGTEPSLSTDADAVDFLTIMREGSRTYAVLTTDWANIVIHPTGLCYPAP